MNRVFVPVNLRTRQKNVGGVSVSSFSSRSVYLYQKPKWCASRLSVCVFLVVLVYSSNLFIFVSQEIMIF